MYQLYFWLCDNTFLISVFAKTSRCIQTKTVFRATFLRAVLYVLMTDIDINELKQLVLQTLEAKDALGKIKVCTRAAQWQLTSNVQAQLRASVYTAIEEQERASGVYLENPTTRKLLDSGEGKQPLIVCCNLHNKSFRKNRCWSASWVLWVLWIRIYLLRIPSGGKPSMHCTPVHTHTQTAHTTSTTPSRTHVFTLPFLPFTSFISTSNTTYTPTLHHAATILQWS